MKQKRKLLLSLSLVLLLGAVTAFASSQGSAENPLVSLSYLKEVFAPSLLQESKTQANALADDMEQEFQQKIDEYTQEMEESIEGADGNAGSGQGGGAVFQLVDMTDGQVLRGDIGTEILLRVGQAYCQSPSNPCLIDSTAGTTNNAGDFLQKNHLYMMTMDERTVVAQANTVKLLVRGSYWVS